MSRNFQLRAGVIETVRSYCESQGVSTYIWVQLDEACSVPRSFAQGNAIVLDISELAVNRFSMADGWLVFQARFGEANEIETIEVPLNRIVLVAPESDPQNGASFMVFPTTDEVKNARSNGAREATPRPAMRRPTRVK